jgi:hypothetical protein
MSDHHPAQERSFAALPKPEAEEAAPAPRKTRSSLFTLPEGAIGIFFLVLLAALSGGLIATYWPWMLGGGETSSTNDRLTSLETRIGQIAAGHAPKAAVEAFAAERRDLSALKDRIDADEARVTALEKTGGANETGEAGGLRTQLDEEAARLARLEQSGGNAQVLARLEALDKAIAQARKANDDRSQLLSASVTAMGQRVAVLERNAPPADLALRLDSLATKESQAALDARVTKLETEDPSQLVRRAASVLALADLLRVTASPSPFANELATLRALQPQAPEIDTLTKTADRGVSTEAMLTEQFSRKADSILAAERRAQARSWLERVWINVTSLVAIRRVGDVSGATTEDHLARAEVHLKHGELERAIAEVSALQGPARQAAASWLVQAQARAALERSLRSLSNRMVAELAAPLAQTAATNPAGPVRP